PAKIALPMGSRGTMGTPVLSADGKSAWATLGTGSFTAGAIVRFDLAASTASFMTMPSAADVSALYGTLDPRSVPMGIHCCDFWSAPVLGADGHLLAVATSGVLLDWASPTTNAPPAIAWIFKTAVELAQQGGDFTVLATCLQEASCTRGGL